MSEFFHIDPRIEKAAQKALELCRESFLKIEEITEYNQQKMLAAFAKAGVSESHFVASTGYGYGDRGRDALDQVYAMAFQAENALVRHNFVSGTHALTVALFGVLRPGDTMLSVTGIPYDTLRGVIGLEGDSSGSLKEFGIRYEQVELKEDGGLDFDAIAKRVKPGLKMVYLQRSRGYSLRPSLFVEEIERVAKLVKSQAPDCIVMVDNCYGEFGREVGATLGQNRELFMGAFHAPHVTGEALKTAAFAAALYELLGFEVTPRFSDPRADIIQVMKLGNEKSLVAFCQGIQKGAPVDSFVTPEPWDMPGYDSQVIMAAGAFTLGASIELSADAPLREPYAAWMQGGLNFHSGKLGVMLAAQAMLENGTLKF